MERMALLDKISGTCALEEAFVHGTCAMHITYIPYCWLECGQKEFEVYSVHLKCAHLESYQIESFSSDW